MSAELVKHNKLELATLVDNRELVDMTSPFGRSKRHLVFKLPQGVTYAAGDYRRCCRRTLRSSWSAPRAASG
ncbi:hypothetical protein ACN28S_20265 [Cystobacter fuscus]